MKYIDVIRMIKRASADVADVYKDLRRRFWEYVPDTDAGYSGLTDDEVDRRAKGYTNKELSKILDSRQKLLKTLENYYELGPIDLPLEASRFSRRLEEMRDDALFTRYLPERGPLNPDRVPKKYRNILLGALPREAFLTTKIPTKDNMALYFRDDVWRPFDRDHVTSGRYGEILKKLYEDGAIKTQGDWDSAVMENRKSMPKQEQQDLREWLRWRLKEAGKQQ